MTNESKIRRPNRGWRRLGRTLLGFFLFINVFVFMQARAFTRIEDGPGLTPEQFDALPTPQRVGKVFMGIAGTKKPNTKTPTVPFTTVVLAHPSNKDLDLNAWHLKRDSAKGTVIMFHGHLSNKADQLERAEAIYAMGFHVFVVDQRAHGDSEGNTCTIGYREEEDVMIAYNYIVGAQKTPDSALLKTKAPIYLFGSSMGSASCMRALALHGKNELDVAGLMIECPFASLLEAAAGRIKMMGAPSFPLANMLVFYGGIQQGYWAFDHKPSAYATKISCPTLLLWGEKDPRVLRHETDEIFANLAGPKTLKTFPNSVHESYLIKHEAEWKTSVQTFLVQTQR